MSEPKVSQVIRERIANMRDAQRRCAGERWMRWNQGIEALLGILPLVEAQEKEYEAKKSDR